MTRRPLPISDDTTDTTWRDLIMLTLCGFLVCIVIMVPWISSKRAMNGQQGIKPPGAVMVELRWPDEDASDIDLWVQAPGDVPVGYSNKGGAVFNLLRDDLGHTVDLTGMNYENAVARGIVPGEYTVNLHAYRTVTAPVPCKVVVSVQRDSNMPMVQILATEVTLQRERQEKTALRFKLDQSGGLVSGSVNSAQKALRSGAK